MSELHVVGRRSEAALADVVFVHGLGGHWRETWCHGGLGEEGFWPAWLAEDLPQAQVWSLGYDASPSNWLGRSMPLVDRAANALTRLEVEGLGRRPLLFVCHSFGGLLVKQLLRSALGHGGEAWRRLADQTRAIAFLSTPHAGARLADYVGASGASCVPR